jgi:hypothetical protein
VEFTTYMTPPQAEVGSREERERERIGKRERGK